MKKNYLFFFAALTAITLGGCSTTGTVPIQQAQQSSPAAVSEIPEWFSMPPKSDATAMYAVASENSRDLQLAIDKAAMSARMKISEQMRADISSLQNTFKAEGGNQADSHIEKFFNQVADQFSQQSIRGCTVVKQKIIRDDATYYRAFILVTYPLGQANEELLNKIRQADFVKSQQSADNALQKLEQRRQESQQQ